MTRTADPLLGTGVSEPEITAAARAALRRPQAHVGPWWATPVDHAIGQPTTAALVRVGGLATDCTGVAPWSLFLKVIQSFRSWPRLAVLPPQLREHALAGRAWCYEADLYASDLHRLLPAGLRLPAVHRISVLDEDRIAMWLEDVRALDAAWDLPRFERAARLLGRLAARFVLADPLPVPSPPGGGGNRGWYTGRVLVAALPALRDPATWTHPLLAAAVDRDLRADIAELAERVPAMLDTLDALPHTFAHGDACPQNLLVPATDPDGFVAVDWFPAGRVAVGHDLSQLLVGLAHSGQLDPDELPAVHDTILAGYTGGLADEGVLVAEDVVRYGFDAALVVRCAFTALPLDDLGQPPTPELAAQLTRRARLTRYLVDLGLALPDDVAGTHARRPGTPTVQHAG